MSLTLWPREYERKNNLTKEEKKVLYTVAQNFDEGHVAVGIDPVGLCTPENRMGLFISPEKGLLTFSTYTGEFNENMIDAYIMITEKYENLIYQRLLDSKMLISRDGEKKVLKFPYKHLMVFANVDRMNIKGDKERLNRFSAYATAKNFTPVNSKERKLKKKDLKIFSEYRKNYDLNFSKISEDECKAVFERLAPEYVVVMPEVEKITISAAKTTRISEEDLYITGKESEYKTFFLDGDQVDIVNDMGKGHRVMLANPGAGKSVLLLSKAFKYASTYKESKVLLTCYNTNLADAYRFKQSCADFGDNRNLYIMTFHKLVKKLFNDCLGRGIAGDFASEEEIQLCIDYVKKGKIKQRFKAIFIDEVQIFEPKFLELCYYLLEKPIDDSLFLLAGDLNQTVRSQSRRGDAPWKKIEGVELDFTGRVRYIKKNYRNTKEISEYLSRMLKYMNVKMKGLGVMLPSEYDYTSFETSIKPSTALKIVTGIPRMKVVKEVIHSVNEIVNKYNVSYSDIAIIFPFKKMSTLNYFFMYWLEQEFGRSGIPYCSIISSESDCHRRYSQSSGIILTTIDSSLGLDFKAVIVAGLYPYNYIYEDNGAKKEINSWSQVEKLGLEMKEKFMIEVRKTYTAASRAREILYIISDLNAETPIENVIKR